MGITGVWNWVAHYSHGPSNLTDLPDLFEDAQYHISSSDFIIKTNINQDISIMQYELQGRCEKTVQITIG